MDHCLSCLYILFRFAIYFLSFDKQLQTTPFVSSNISLNSDVQQFHQYQINENRRSSEINERKNDRDII
jgi:hypothetical protein